MNFIEKELIELDICKTILEKKSIGGGCINNASRYTTDKGNFFVKTQTSPKTSEWYLAESIALDHINKAVKEFAPQPIHRADKYIVMEYIDMTSRGMHNQDTQRELGHRLGNMHKATSERFGFEVTSFCGTTELDNTWSTSWSHFWTKQRMEPLFDSVRGQNPDLDSMGQQLCARMDHWLGPDALPNITPALLHGDLWSGNWSIRQSDGMPIIYDPATFFGHSEAELGIMRMFGGFGQDFFDVYDQVIPPAAGRKERLEIYELYHHLNHYSMFGGGYDSGCLSILEKLL